MGGGSLHRLAKYVLALATARRGPATLDEDRPGAERQRPDLGLPAEEYDVKRQRQVGNFPQAFSHLTLIGVPMAIAKAGSSAAA